MATRRDSLIQFYDFSEEELLNACTFTDLQTKYLQTELATLTTEKILHEYDPKSANADKEFILTQEFLRGRIATLMYLLGTSEDRKDKLLEALRGKQESQSADAEEKKPIVTITPNQ